MARRDTTRTPDPLIKSPGAARLVALMLFLVGIAINLVLGCLAAPDILPVVSSAVRNLGLMVMGHPILLKPDPGRLRH